MSASTSQHFEVAANGPRTLVRFNALTTEEIAEGSTQLGIRRSQTGIGSSWQTRRRSEKHEFQHTPAQID